MLQRPGLTSTGHSRNCHSVSWLRPESLYTEQKTVLKLWERVGTEEGRHGLGEGFLLPLMTANPAQIPGLGIWALPQARLIEGKTISTDPPSKRRKGQGLTAYIQGRRGGHRDGFHHTRQKARFQCGGKVLSLVWVLLQKCDHLVKIPQAIHTLSTCAVFCTCVYFN